MTKRNYEEEAIKLSKAIDIAMESFEKYPPKIWSEEVLNHVISCYAEWKDQALNPEPKFKKITSLKYIIEDVFTIFQEGSGNEIEYFWQQIEKHNLDYIREDKLVKILKRGKIKDQTEYEFVTDIIVAAKQEKRITDIEAKELVGLIGEFELRKRK